MRGDLWNSVTPSSIVTFTWWGSQKEEREKGTENIFEEIIDENFPNLGKETDIQMKEAQTTPPKSTKADPHQDLIKLAKYSDYFFLKQQDKRKQEQTGESP